MTLTLLNFSKLLMYLDLDPNRWPKGTNIINHPLVAQFLNDYDPDAQDEDSPDESLGFGEEYPIDELREIHTKYPLIDDADSSQHSALIDAVDGKNLVIEGPPGTGKSQTITNLIAACLSQGKKVLFVAEKQAALEVVKRRLDNVGLGEFCLELHSHKSQKRKILDEVENRLDRHHKYRKPSDIDFDIARLEELKLELKDHAERINGVWKNTGKTIHTIFMSATRYRRKLNTSPTNFHPEGISGEEFDVSKQKFVIDQVHGYQKIYQAIAGQLDGGVVLQNHPWFGFNNSELHIFEIDKVVESLVAWQASLEDISCERKRISEKLNCQCSEIPNSINELTLCLSDLVNFPQFSDERYLAQLPLLTGDVLCAANGYLSQYKDLQEQYEYISEKIGEEFLEDLSRIDIFLEGDKQLKQLVDASVSLGQLADAMNRLEAIQNQLSGIVEPLSQIKSSIGSDVSAHFVPSIKGLSEFVTFLNLIDSLKPSYWKIRDERFDNDEMDELLPDLREDLTNLLLMYNEIFRVFKVGELPEHEELLQLKTTIERGGLFRWFKSDWRAAKKRMLSLACDDQVTFKQMKAMLGKATQFSEQLRKIENNSKYNEVFGDLIQGFETDLSAIESLRMWYKSVRAEYGVGFGPRVNLGLAVMNLPIEFSRGIRSLSEQGLKTQLIDLLDDLESLKIIFAPVSKMQDTSTLLSGQDGLISWLLSSLVEPIEACGLLVADNTVSLTELSKRIESLSNYKESIVEWDQNDFNDKYFDGKLEFFIGGDQTDVSSLASFECILNLAEYLEFKAKTNFIKDVIRQNPSIVLTDGFCSIPVSLKGVLDSQIIKFDAFKSIAQLNVEDWQCDSDSDVDVVISKNQRAITNKSALNNWLDYLRIKNQLFSMGLSCLLNEIEQGNIDITEIQDAYLAGVYDLLAREVFQEKPELAKFSGLSQNVLQSKFKEYDNKLKRLQCERIAWRIDQVDIPNGLRGARVSEHTDLFLLRHECSKKTRHIPIRQLLLKAGNALLATKPCFMMGPMSVAQYLAPGKFKFDVIIMDEASQIKPQDALGTIARGSQLVVVGDPKQLPPTSFFDRVVSADEKDQTAIEESESILDATLPIFPSRRLRWHYRSQHESLIAFSNHSFYKSDMVLFPSPNKEINGFGLKYSKVEKGCFVNRRNIKEAQAICEAVKKHLKKYPDDSIGVVAMSSEQRLQIEREIEANAKDDYVFQTLLQNNESKEEPLFIKNLENVQGDERDVILISMTYGPQEPGGRVFQRFGPINSDVGWRRLNVLFTRSKKRMQIFSSMSSDDIIADSKAKRGVRALRDFLNFCETGILHKVERETGRPPESDFEIAVMDALKEEGFECVPQVGVAGFFIDLAVLDPGNPGRYLMGIECDGATYHSAKSVRDRDRLRQTILERLGWNIKRIWSTDWFKNPSGELQPIIRELNVLKSEIKEYKEFEINSIEGEQDKDQTTANELVSQQMGLEEKLMTFDKDVIRKELPNTPDNKRLLRPAMLEAFLEHMPCSKAEFLEYIPSYLRGATLGVEGKFLVDVLEIINANIE
ncbi:MAG: AAA domain-containing protein [Desulfobacterales bacterium]|nr:AAA domain-containing protein [Desulfobacterales bacterium]